MPARRSIWKGSISFGLVNIPVKIYTATESKAYSFNQLCPNGHRIEYKRWCPVEEVEVPWKDIQKGYEVSSDRCIILDKEDFEKIKIKTTKTIHIKEFIDGKDLDPLFISNSYYVRPDTKTANKAYLLLVNLLRKMDKVAIGKVVMRDREHLVALKAYQRGMTMHELHYLEEIRPTDEIKVEQAKVDEQEISLGENLIESLQSKEFDQSKYSDAYSSQLKELIEAKAHGKTHVIKEAEPEIDSDKDLLEALKASVRKSKSK